MAAVAPNFAILLDLAKETSSEKRRELLRQFHEIAGSKKNMARIRDWYEEKPELLQALEKLREVGALDVGEV